MPPQYPGHPCVHDPGGKGGHDVGPEVAGGDGGDGVFGVGGDGGPKMQSGLGSHPFWLLGEVPLGQQNAPPLL